MMNLLNVELLLKISSRNMSLDRCVLTWLSFCVAGRLLASFRSSFSHLVPDGTSEVYVKKTKAPDTKEQTTQS